MDLVCSNINNNDYKISLFGVSLMLGLAFGSFTLTNISDIYGRKFVLVACLLVSSLYLVFIIAFQSNYTVTILFTFLFGMTTACRYSVSVIHAIELSTFQNKSFYVTTMIFQDAAASYLMGIYYYFIKSMDPSLVLLIFI